VRLNGEPQVKSSTRHTEVLTGKWGDLIQNLNQRTPSIVEYQAGRTTYRMIKNLYWGFMGRPIPVHEN